MTNIHTNDRGGGISSDNKRNIPSVKEKITMIELCSGIGCQFQGVKNTPCFAPEVVATSEIDINAILSYAAIHHGLTKEMIENYHYPSVEDMKKHLTNLNIGYDPDKHKIYDWYKNGKKFEELVKKVYLACVLNKNLGDMSRITELPKADVWFTSTPCTDISVAGRLGGINQDDKTRSSLIWHNIRLLREAQKNDKLPKFIFLENVKNLVGKRFLHDFEDFNELIESFGYHTHYSIINAKNCGIPQNRERIFAIYIRKDIDSGQFTFPKPFDNGLRLKDVLEDDVDESYFITSPKAKILIQKLLDDGVIGNDNLNRQTDRRSICVSKSQNQLTSQTVLQQENQQGSQIYNPPKQESYTETIALSMRNPRKINNALTITVSEFHRGLSYFGVCSNGVVKNK